MIPYVIRQYVEMGLSYGFGCAEYDELQIWGQRNPIHAEHSVYRYYCQMTACSVVSVRLHIMRIGCKKKPDVSPSGPPIAE